MGQELKSPSPHRSSPSPSPSPSPWPSSPSPVEVLKKSDSSPTWVQVQDSSPTTLPAIQTTAFRTVNCSNRENMITSSFYTHIRLYSLSQEVLDVGRPRSRVQMGSTLSRSASYIRNNKHRQNDTGGSKARCHLQTALDWSPLSSRWVAVWSYLIVKIKCR